MQTWLTAETTYEGFPLYLRRPAEVDINRLRTALPILVVVTHKFTKRLPNGLPEPDYNHGLAKMDADLVAAFDVDQMGVPVLVETFGGKRNYYFYSAKHADIEGILSAIAGRYPDEHLRWSIQPDPRWDFIERYAKEYF